jgi:hypothetical protein
MIKVGTKLTPKAHFRIAYSIEEGKKVTVKEFSGNYGRVEWDDGSYAGMINWVEDFEVTGNVNDEISTILAKYEIKEANLVTSSGKEISIYINN